MENMMPKKKEEISFEEIYLSHGIDFKNRSIRFGRILDNNASDEDNKDICDFDNDSVELAIRGINILLNISQNDPINLYMSSYGGDPLAMLKLYDRIQSCPCPVRFYGSGMIMSSATWIMCSCDERYLDANVSIMIHAGYTGAVSSVTIGEADINMKIEKKLMEKLYKIFSENSIMPEKFWREVCKKDTHLSAHEAIVLGLADEIIEKIDRNQMQTKKNINLSIKRDNKQLSKIIKDIYGRINTTDPLMSIEQNNRKKVKNKEEYEETVRGMVLGEIQSAMDHVLNSIKEGNE